MRILKWRVWDRLDQLDRRAGVPPDWTKPRTTFLRVFASILTAMAVVNAVRTDWAAAMVEGSLAAILGLLHLRKVRRRARDEDESSARS